MDLKRFSYILGCLKGVLRRIKVFIPENDLMRVKSSDTRKYVEEVLSSYYNANYRASIVTLYTTVIFDCFNKLITLKELYNDVNAATELNTIETMQRNPQTPYSDIEKKIIEVISETGLINHIELEQINQLKTARNNAAHPVFNNNYELINPTKEQVIAHIRNMYEALFMKDVILSKRILESFRTDICGFYERQPDLQGYDIYLESKYYKRFNELTKKYIFNELWKYTFWFDDDEDCSKNRRLFLRTLVRFMDWDKELFKEYIKANERLYAKVVFKSIEPIEQLRDFNKYGCSALLVLIQNHPKLWEDIPEDTKIDIINLRRNDPNIVLYSEFTSESDIAYFASITECLKTNNIRRPCLNPTLLRLKYDKHKEHYGGLIRKKIVDYYNYNTDSSAFEDDFDYINELYNRVIKDVLYDFSEEELIYLLDSVDRYNYMKATSNDEFSAQVCEIINEKGFSIDKSKYCTIKE